MILKEIIHKLLEEVDPDIKEILIKKDEKEGYEGWETLHSPVLAILEWQKMRHK